MSGGRADLAASASLDRGIFDGDVDDDEEEECLLYDAEEQAGEIADSMMQAYVSQNGGDMTDVSINDITASIEQDMQRLNIGVPQLETVHMSVLVQFWQDGGTVDEPLKFLHESGDWTVERSVMLKYCTELCEAPFRMRHIVVDEDESDEDEDDIPEDEEDPPDFAIDDVPREWIPERGRVNVLVVIMAQAPVIVGLLTERYDLTGAGADDDEIDLDRLNANGKRIQWLDGAVSAKRSRVEELDTESAISAAAPDDDDAMLMGMHTFAADGNKEWTSAINRSALVCGFERDEETGKLAQVRVALALHTLDLRHTLQTLLGESRNTL